MTRSSAYLWATVLPSLFISTSVSLSASESIIASAFISESKVTSLATLNSASLLGSLVQCLGLYLWQCVASCLILHFDNLLASLSN